MRRNKPIDVIRLFINGLREFCASLSKNMFGWAERPIKDFRSEPWGRDSTHRPYKPRSQGPARGHGFRWQSDRGTLAHGRGSGDPARSTPFRGESPQNKPGMCLKISIIGSSPLYQGFSPEDKEELKPGCPTFGSTVHHPWPYRTIERRPRPLETVKSRLPSPS